jgi:aryl-alcohol dehydrogenase-like predicted oxidoreductase
MDDVKLGRIGLDVSQICLGCMSNGVGPSLSLTHDLK